MSKCLTCEKEIESVEGKRERLYCSDKCRVKFNQTKKRKTVTIPRKEYEELLSKIVEQNRPEMNKIANDVAELGVAIYETTENGIRHVDPLSDEGQKVMDDAERKEIEDRIKQLEYEIAHPIKTAIFTQAQYKKSREVDLEKLKAKLNL